MRQIAAACETDLRRLHKLCRIAGLPEASFLALDAADRVLATARALAAEPPPRRTSQLMSGAHLHLAQ